MRQQIPKHNYYRPDRKTDYYYYYYYYYYHDAKATKKYKTGRGPTKNDQRRHVSTQRIKT